METAHQGYGAVRRMADGGLVSTLKNKLFGPPETMTQKFARQDAERAAKAPPPPVVKPAPAPPPAANTISGYAAGTAMKEREKAAGLAKGGAIKGKGTGTSDEVPIMASNGEFMIKAKAVQKIGIPALEALNAIADGKSAKPAMQKGKYMHGGAILKMATGGLVEDERRRALVAQIPTDGSAAPVGGERVEGSELSRNVGNTLNAVGGATGVGVLPRAAGAISTLATRAANAVGTTTGAAAVGRSGAALGPIAIAPATASPAPLPATATVSAGVAPTAPASSATEILSAAPNAITRTGNSYTGAPNIAGNVSVQNPDGTARQPSGVITAQNNQAAAGLSARYTGSPAQQGLGAIRGGGQVSSIDTSAGYAQDLKDLARIDVAKATQNAGLKDQATFAQNQALTERYLRGNRAAGAILRNNAQADLATRGQDLQAGQQGAIQRLAQQKFGVDAAGAALDQQEKSALVKAQAAFINAKTPAEQSAAETTLRTLQGKYEKAAPPEQYAFAPGGQTVDPATGLAVTQPGVIFNKQTGEVKQQGAAKPGAITKQQYDALPKGAKYTHPDGTTRTKG